MLRWNACPIVSPSPPTIAACDQALGLNTPHFSFLIKRSLEKVLFAINPNGKLIQAPSPLDDLANLATRALLAFRDKNGSVALPPESDGLVADVVS